METERIALVVNGLAVLLSTIAIIVSFVVLKKQIEWQQRVAEKQVYYQIIESEWKQDCAQGKTSPDLRTRLIQGGVLKKIDIKRSK